MLTQYLKTSAVHCHFFFFFLVPRQCSRKEKPRKVREKKRKAAQQRVLLLLQTGTKKTDSRRSVGVNGESAAKLCSSIWPRRARISPPDGRKKLRASCPARNDN